MSTDPILVIGATGKTGARIAKRLSAQGRSVRAGSRRAPIPFDWDRPETWKEALAGVRRAYIAYFPDIAMSGAVAKVEALCAAAKKADLERLVLLSGRGEYHAGLGEEVVRASGVDFTVLRAAWFAQNFSEGYLRAPILSGVLPMPGADVKEPIVDIDDIAEIAAAALTEDRHQNAVYEITGPRLMSFAEMAQSLSIAIGRPINHAPISFEAFHARILEMAGPAIADVFTAIARETLDGRNASIADGVEQALGRAPRDFDDFAREAAAAGAWSAAA